MEDFESLAHVRWKCKYHVIFIPKYRRKVIFGSFRLSIGQILRELCDQKGIGLLEGHAMGDHVHLCLSIPPKYSVGIHDRISEGEECRQNPSGITAVQISQNLKFLY